MSTFYAVYPFEVGSGGGGGSGTVTSVGLADGSGVPIYNITGSPVTTSGTLTFSLKTETANKVFSGPTTGSAAQPTFRTLVAADLPAGTGTVTSVGLTMPGIFSVAGSPVTTSGTLAVTLATETANTVWAGPTSGGAATPTFRTLVAADIPSNTQIASFGITIDGGGSVITTGVKGYTYIPYGCTINSVTMLADQSGSIVVDIWKVAYASFPPLVANTITASDIPTISSAQKSQDTTLTGWTTSVSAGDTIAFNVNSATTITRLNMILKVTKT